MNAPAIVTNKVIPRRFMLKGLGVSLSLPMLHAMTPAIARSHEPSDSESSVSPRRMLAVCNNLGLLPNHFFPQSSGRDYQSSDYLETLGEYRDDFTVFSGVCHPDVDGGHPADNCFLTAAPHPGSGGFHNTISLDQFLAERMKPFTRFPSLTLGVNIQKGQRSLSWTSAGVLIPCEESASTVYKQLFLQGREADIERQVRRLQLGESIMDVVAEQTSDLKRSLGVRDRNRVDQYLTGVRELEKRIAMSRDWERRPKPKAPVPAPLDPGDPSAYMEKVRLMYDMARLAFESDSTRLVTLMLDSVNSPVIDIEGIEITDGYHNLSHHGKSEKKLKQLKEIDQWHMKLLADLFGKLKSVREQQNSLLDRTMVLYGSNFGDANAHVNTNLPVLLAGGGFRHGQHLSFDTENNYPLTNLFVSMIQRMGVDADRFASSTGTMSGLAMV